MKDEQFIRQTLARGQEAREKVENQLSGISPAQLNWKPSSEQWSIGECLDHLFISDREYFDNLQKISDGSYKMSFWEKYSPMTSLWGKELKDRLGETVKKKMEAPKKLTPAKSDKPDGFVKLYLNNLDVFLSLIAACKHADLDRTIITSPTIKIATYSLRDSFEFLITHEHRHINQAIRVKSYPGFPATG